eukprot:15365057-Ditylum_brightwellii.AAC.1
MRVTSKDIIDHLLNQYGKTTPSDLTCNYQKSQQEVDMFKTFNVYFTQINDCTHEIEEEEGQLTANEAGFHKANVMQDVLATIDNLTNAVIDDWSITTQLVDSNAKLTETNKQLVEHVKKLQNNYSQVHDMIKDIKNKGTSNTPRENTRK